jgi:hypothetical protein
MVAADQQEAAISLQHYILKLRCFQGHIVNANAYYYYPKAGGSEHGLTFAQSSLHLVMTKGL